MCAGCIRGTWGLCSVCAVCAAFGSLGLSFCSKLGGVPAWSTGMGEWFILGRIIGNYIGTTIGIHSPILY